MLEKVERAAKGGADSALRSSPVRSFGYFRLGPGPGPVQYFINQDRT